MIGKLVFGAITGIIIGLICYVIGYETGKKDQKYFDYLDMHTKEKKDGGIQT